MRYTSIQSHLGFEQSRKDDIESLAYSLIYFMKGSLPWQGVKESNVKIKYEQTLKKKLNTPTSILCAGLPSKYLSNQLIIVEFESLVQYARNLKFEEEPNYEYLRKLFKERLFNEGYDKESIFDWGSNIVKN